MARPPDAACPCGRADARGKPLGFAQCCGRYLRGDAAAPDAQSLMRSRYTAFVLGDEPYLLRTWHASTRPAQATVEPGTRWLGLQVRGHRALDADHVEVEFVARYRTAGPGPSTSPGRAARLHERSRFVREDGRWYYVDGHTK